MATVDIADVRPNGNTFAESRLNPPAEFWAPSLAPNETTAAGHVLWDEDASHPVTEGEYFARPPEPRTRSETFGFHRKLMAGTAIVAALGLAGLTYVFLASPGGGALVETTESSPIAVEPSSEAPVQAALDMPEPSSPTRVESSSETSVQSAPTVSESSRGAPGVVSSPDIPTSLATNASPQVARSAVLPQATSAAQNQDRVFLQRPGVNIRSAPSLNARVVGAAPRATQFTARSREGDWVKVENERWKGWIHSQFLTPNKPE
jgi:hypothetical protein